MHARQMGRQRATIGAALIGTCARSSWILLVIFGFVCRNGLFDILKRQIERKRPFDPTGLRA
jgi:hypothetical protein